MPADYMLTKYQVGDYVRFDPTSVWTNRKCHNGVVKSFTKNSSDITIPVVQFYGQDAIEMKEDWGMNAENQLSIHPEYLILLNRGQPEEDVENLESIL